MQNPFSNEHMKNYLLFYSAVILIMVLFYILNTSLNSVEAQEKKVFSTQMSSTVEEGKATPAGDADENSNKNRFKMLEKAY